MCDLNSTEGIEWLRVANRNFGDFRNKFVDSIELLVKSFKEKLRGRFAIFIYCIYYYYCKTLSNILLGVQ